MKTSTKIIMIAFCLSGCYGCEEEAIREYSILPEPQQIEYASGTFKVKDGISIAFPSELAGEAALASQYLSADFGISAILKEGKKSGNITLLLDASVLPEQPEGYVLDIKKKGIVIKAKAPAGILHGIQTLRQIISTHTPVETGHAPSLQTDIQTDIRTDIQCGTIADYPAFGWRAFMLDDARYFQGKDVVCRKLDDMSALKMNVFHWHLVDASGWRIEIKKYPELTTIGAFRDSTGLKWFKSGFFDGKPHGGFYTQDEIREIVAYAAARHITIVPEIEMPGHSTAAIAAYPWLGSTGKKVKVSCDFACYDIVNSYHEYTYLDYPYKTISLKKAYSFNPIPEDLTAEQRKKVLGLGCQMWTAWEPDEKAVNWEVYPRIAAYAEVGWTPQEKKDYDRFLKALDYFLTKWKKQGIEYGQVN